MKISKKEICNVWRHLMILLPYFAFSHVSLSKIPKNALLEERKLYRITQKCKIITVTNRINLINSYIHGVKFLLIN